MKNNELSKVIELKSGKNWINYRTITDPLEVYESLEKDLVAKLIHKCTYIKRIERDPLYIGYERITVTYGNDVRSIYTVKQA